MAGSQRLLHRPDAGLSPAVGSGRAVRGELRLRAEPGETGRTVLAYRHAAGAYHLSKPHWDGHALMVQWINPTAGVFAGDMLRSDVSVGPGEALLLTTPSATRIHTRNDPRLPPGRQYQTFSVASGGFLEVNPEWLMPQRDSAFVQETEIDIESGGGLFFGEILAPGRVAHGEALKFAHLDLRLQLRLGGRLLFRERLRVDQDSLWKLQSSSGGALFTATIVAVLAQPATDVFKEVRAWLDQKHSPFAAATVLGPQVFAVKIAAPTSPRVRQIYNEVRQAFAQACTPLRTSLRKL